MTVVSAQSVIAQASDDGIIPDEPGQIVVWAILAVVIFALYRLLLASRRRASREYFNRRKAEEDRRKNDPDLRQE